MLIYVNNATTVHCTDPCVYCTHIIIIIRRVYAVRKKVLLLLLFYNHHLYNAADVYGIYELISFACRL